MRLGLEHRLLDIGPVVADRLRRATELSLVLARRSALVAAIDASGVIGGVAEYDHGGFVSDQLVVDAELPADVGELTLGKQAGAGLRLERLDPMEGPQALELRVVGTPPTSARSVQPAKPQEPSGVRM